MKPKKIHIEVIKLIDGYKLYIDGRQVGNIISNLDNFNWEATDSEILEAIRHQCQLPQSIQEALNSGDGVYRP